MHPEGDAEGRTNRETYFCKTNDYPVRRDLILTSYYTDRFSSATKWDLTVVKLWPSEDGLYEPPRFAAKGLSILEANAMLKRHGSRNDLFTSKVMRALAELRHPDAYWGKSLYDDAVGVNDAPRR